MSIDQPKNTSNHTLDADTTQLNSAINKIAASWIAEFTQVRRSKSEHLDSTELTAIEKEAGGESSEAATTINKALLEIINPRAGGKQNALIYHLSAAKVKEVQEVIKKSALKKRVKKISDRYLYYLLIGLAKKKLLTFQLPIEAADSSSRPVAFEADDPRLPRPTVLRRWQNGITALAFDVKELKSEISPKKNSDCEYEFRTVAALLAFGCYTSRDALDLLSKLQLEDYNGTENHLWLRNHAGERFLKLSLHPVQGLALNFYLQLNREKFLTAKTEKLFPSLTDSRERQKFNRWLKAVLVKLNDTDKIEAKFVNKNTERFSNVNSLTLLTDCVDREEQVPDVSMLLAGVHRWLLGIYPVYLVSILGGYYASTHLAAEEVDGQQNDRNSIDSLPEGEKKIRAALRSQMKETLGRKKGIPYQKKGTQNQFFFAVKRREMRPEDGERLQKDWEKILLPEGLPSFTAPSLNNLIGKDPQISDIRNWNLFFMMRLLVKKVSAGEITRFNTFSRWFELGCVLLSTLGDEGFWKLNAEVIENIRVSFTFSDGGYVVKHLQGMCAGAAETGFIDARDLEKSLNSINQLKSEKRSVKQEKIPPEIEEIEAVTKYLSSLSENDLEIGRVPAQAVLLYRDLLLLGLRKSEAVELTLVDFDLVYASDGSLIYADLFVAGVKTPAARRVISLLEAAFPDGVQRIIDYLINLREYKNPDALSHMKHFLSFAAKKKISNRPAPSDELEMVIDTIDNALKKASEECCFKRFTPHIHRHGSISEMLEQGQIPTERIALTHGHVDLVTTFNYYVHGLSQIQKSSLLDFLKETIEVDVWVAMPNAADLLGVSKQTLYSKYPMSNSEVDFTNQVIYCQEKILPEESFIVKRKGNPLYIKGSYLITNYVCQVE